MISYGHNVNVKNPCNLYLIDLTDFLSFFPIAAKGTSLTSLVVTLLMLRCLDNYLYYCKNKFTNFYEEKVTNRPMHPFHTMQ